MFVARYWMAAMAKNGAMGNLRKPWRIHVDNLPGDVHENVAGIHWLEKHDLDISLKYHL